MVGGTLIAVEDSTDDGCTLVVQDTTYKDTCRVKTDTPGSHFEPHVNTGAIAWWQAGVIYWTTGDKSVVEEEHKKTSYSY